MSVTSWSMKLVILSRSNCSGPAATMLARVASSLGITCHGGVKRHINEDSSALHLVNPLHGHILELHEQGGHPHLQGVRTHAGGQGVARLHEGQLQGAHLAYHHCTVKNHTDIINFACMTWNFVRISASLSALCTNINQICHWHCISCKILPHFDVRTISVAQKL